MLGPGFSQVANDFGCVKLLRAGTGFVGYSLSESQFRPRLQKVLFKRLIAASLLHHFLPCSPTAAVSLTREGRKVLIPAGKAEKGRTISLKFCDERGRFQRNPKKTCIQLSGNALGLDFTYFSAESKLVLQP